MFGLTWMGRVLSAAIMSSGMLQFFGSSSKYVSSKRHGGSSRKEQAWGQQQGSKANGSSHSTAAEQHLDIQIGSNALRMYALGKHTVRAGTEVR